MTRWIAALLGGFLLACTPVPDTPVVQVPAVPACAPENDFPNWETVLRERVPGRIVRGVFDEESMAAVVEAFNAVEPVTDYDPDAIYTYSSPGAQMLLLVLVADDCILVSGTIAMDLLKSWLEHVNIPAHYPPPGSVEA